MIFGHLMNNMKIKFLRFPRCVSKLLSHLPKTTEFNLCIQMLPK